MGDLVTSAVTIISQSTQRVEIVAQNLSNMTTPAYKKRVVFANMVGNSDESGQGLPVLGISTDFTSGKPVHTGTQTDLMVVGQGFFKLSANGQSIYTRQGQLTRNSDGLLVNAQGLALQLVDGGNLVLKAPDFTVGTDGTVTANGVTLGRIAVYKAGDPQSLTAVTGGYQAGADSMTLTGKGVVTQGSYESSNVSNGAEMVTMMESLRRAESGQRIMNTYDDLMGNVITSFGESQK